VRNKFIWLKAGS